MPRGISTEFGRSLRRGVPRSYRALRRVANMLLTVLGLVTLVPTWRRSVSELADPGIPRAALERLHSIQADRGEDAEFTISDRREYDLSVIVPVYNAERYVAAAIGSLLGQQTQFRFEIIVVDDGSTDSSLEQLDLAIERHGECARPTRVVRTENYGPGAARNTGMALARGAYLMFHDADDLATPDAIEILLGTAFSLDACLVQSELRVVEADFELARRFAARANVGRPALTDLTLPLDADRLFAGLRGYPCAKVFRRELFVGASFPRKYDFEDTIVSLTIAHRARRIVLTDAVTYIYNVNDSSITAGARSGAHGIDTAYVVRYCLDLNAQLGIESSALLYRQLLSQFGQHLWRRTSMLPRSVQSDLLIYATEILGEHRPYRSPDLSLKERLLERAIAHQELAAFGFLARI